MVPRPRLRQPPRRPANVARTGLPPERRPHGQGDRVRPRLEGDRAGEALLPLLRVGCVPCAAPRPQGVGRQVQGPVRHGLRGDPRADARPPEGARDRPEGHRAAADQPDRNDRAHRARGQAVPRGRRHTAVGLALGRREEAVLPHGRGLRRFPCARRRPDRAAARLPRGVGLAREHARDARLGQRCLGRGRPERLGQRDEDHERHPRHDRGEPAADRRDRRHEDLQPLPERLGDGVQHAVQDVEALRVQRRHVRPVHRLVAGGDEVQGRDPPPVPPRRRPRAERARRPRRRGAADDQGPRPEPLRRRQHAFQLRRSEGAVDEVDAVLRDARLAGDLARRLEGGHEPPDDRRLEQLQRRRVGAVPHRGRPLGAAQSRRRAPGQGRGSS